MEISPNDVTEALAAANNLNAALKTLLKREGKPGNTVEPFVKSLRGVVTRNRDDELRKYIHDHYETKPGHFAMLMSYAFPKVRDSIGESVYLKYAEAFNATFERNENSVRVVDLTKFTTIANQVSVMIAEGLEQSQVPVNNFSKYAIMATIFEPDVLQEVLKVLR